ncbi:MAG: hypothetical protein QOE96_473 [Blastocatellia bacterium]|nr:hypothetical protein [Blastocatellia bacterium]
MGEAKAIGAVEEFFWAGGDDCVFAIGEDTGEDTGVAAGFDPEFDAGVAEEPVLLAEFELRASRAVGRVERSTPFLLAEDVVAFR